MPHSLAEVENNGLRLPPEDRARLAVRFLSRLEETTESPEEIEKLWIAEAERRFRGLRNGVVHPDALHAYSCGHVLEGRDRPTRRRVRPAPQDPPAQHFVQHGATDLHYPSGHLQGFGFVARQHEVASHVRLESSQVKAAEPVPTKSVSSYS